jgi:Mn-dependent DtxR family transcriptional regulator
LTQELLARLVRSRRPSVSAARGRLADEGLVIRRSSGGWAENKEASRVRGFVQILSPR